MDCVLYKNMKSCLRKKVYKKYPCIYTFIRVKFKKQKKTKKFIK